MILKDNYIVLFVMVNKVVIKKILDEKYFLIFFGDEFIDCKEVFNYFL